MDNERIEVSEELKELYRLIKKLDSNENNSAYHYFKFIVRNGDRDYLFLLFNVLKEMEKKGYIFD